MKVLDLFSGIGGFSLGLEWAGMSTVAMCEKDPYCRKILAKHWPDLTIHEDIRNLDGKKYTNSIDLVCGGFPCQPFSVAGKQRGKLDDRHLWPEMLRVIKESKPRWVIGENVLGFINMALDDVQADLEREHYEVRKFVLPAVAVDAKHRRDRIILIAYSNSPAIWDIPERQAQGRDNLQAGRQAITTHDGSTQSLANTQHDGFSPPSERGSTEETVRQESKGSKHSLNTEGTGSLSSSRSDVANSYCEGLEIGQGFGEHTQSELSTIERSGCEEPAVWSPEPRVGRVANGVPNRVDRIKGLGNAVVPQLIQAIGELVIKADREMRSGR
jgi:DNA (cytosine-5)-methyltransferase 1